MKFKEYNKISNILRENGVTNITRETVELFYEDVQIELTENDKVETDRVFENVSEFFDVDSDRAKQIVEKVCDKIKNESDDEDEDYDYYSTYKLGSEMISMFGELDFGDDDDDDDYMESVKGRAPKLTGKAEKARSAKAEIMGKLKKDDKYIKAVAKIKNIVNLLVKKYAKEAGIAPKKIKLKEPRF